MKILNLAGGLLHEVESGSLRGADLRGADLRGADLRGAYLSGGDLSGAYLRGANLRGAYLSGAKMNWDSHDLIAARLLQAAYQDAERRKIAGLILVSRDWCWERFLRVFSSDPLWSWGLTEMRTWIVEDDGHPAILDEEVSK